MQSLTRSSKHPSKGSAAASIFPCNSGFREVKGLAQGHTSRKWQNWDWTNLQHPCQPSVFSTVERTGLMGRTGFIK